MKRLLFVSFLVSLTGCSAATPYLRGRTVSPDEVDYWNRKQLIYLLNDCRDENARLRDRLELYTQSLEKDPKK